MISDKKNTENNNNRVTTHSHESTQYYSCGYYAFSSFRSAATRLAYDMNLDTYVRGSHLFIFV